MTTSRTNYICMITRSVAVAFIVVVIVSAAAEEEWYKMERKKKQNYVIPFGYKILVLN